MHLLSLDVEGAELIVLNSMDWSIQVHVWMIELDGTNPAKDDAVRGLLRSHGYVSHPKPSRGNTLKDSELFLHGSLQGSVAARTVHCRRCTVDHSFNGSAAWKG